MTNQTGVKEQVEQVIAGKILGKLAKLGAAEERALKHSVAAVQVRHDGHGFAKVHTTTKNIPGSVVAGVLAKLGRRGLVRKISVAGETFIARRNAPREQLLTAVKLSLGETRYSAYAATLPGRRQRYQDGETSFEMAQAMPLTDPEEIHYSEREDAMTYEGSVADEPFEAEIPHDPEANRQRRPGRALAGYKLEEQGDTEWNRVRFGRPTLYASVKTITPEVRAKIAYQDRIGQGARNTRRARARYLKTDPAMQQWLARKEMEENARREELRAFHTGESDVAGIAPAMSPEQAHEDHLNL